MVPSCKRDAGMNIGVTGGAEGGGVRFAYKSRRSLLIRFTYAHTLVLGRLELVGGVDPSVAGGAEVRRVWAALYGAGGGAAGVADASPGVYHKRNPKNATNFDVFLIGHFFLGKLPGSVWNTYKLPNDIGNY
ncbi:hypothetical protein L2E82_22824 [Cichorium intybus]|uniref:Uncharacterized protein n=1 Tax=Cichorium intybus TaxID=13427 RepID=A0ACB9DYE7_CICIN|nr:hypothetical protein L2E82_22824 [Cichorium intybus]